MINFSPPEPGTEITDVEYHARWWLAWLLPVSHRIFDIAYWHAEKRERHYRYGENGILEPLDD